MILWKKVGRVLVENRLTVPGPIPETISLTFRHSKLFRHVFFLRNNLKNKNPLIFSSPTTCVFEQLRTKQRVLFL